MDEGSKKRLKTQFRDHQRKAARSALPLSIPELEAMFERLNIELEAQGCDHSRRLTQAWLESHGHDVESVFAWLDTQGGYCDCEVLANVEEKVDEAKKASGWPPN